MSRRDDERDNAADWDDDPDAPLESDLDDNEDEDESATTPCPHCGRSVYDDSDRCPHCGDWVVAGRLAERRSGRWALVVVLAVAALLATWLLSRVPR